MLSTNSHTSSLFGFRSRKHRLNPFAALCGSSITAFDDVGVEDPDFEHIQSKV